MTLLTPSRSAASRTLAMIGHCLRRRHHRQILERPEDQRAALAPLAALAFLPRDGSLTFSSPIVKVGAAVLLVLHWLPSQDPHRNGGHVGLLRGYTAWFSRPFSRVYWDEQGAAFAVDLAAPLRPWSYLGRAPGNGLSTLRMALDMDRALERRSWIPYPVHGVPQLPPTLLAFPKGTRLEPEATPLVLARAAAEKVSWQDAWEILRHDLRVPEALCPDGCDLIDTRLCTRTRGTGPHPRPTGVYHDLRGCLDRPVFNPLRDAPLPPGLSPEQRAAEMRRRMAPDIAAVCKDEDLLAAAADSRTSVVVRGLSHVQVWHRPVLATGPEAFCVRDAAVHADLWALGPEWLERLGVLAPQDGPRGPLCPDRPALPPLRSDWAA